MANVAGIRTYQPRVTVTLTKVIKFADGNAKRYVAANNRIDLTPFLDDNGSVVTHKDITQPLGSFTLSFADKADKAVADSVYGIVAPMDCIEIRMAREPWRYHGEELPIIMRGYVTHVKRDQSVDDDGRPVRTVTVQGQDAGKLLQMLQIFYERNYALGQDLTTLFRLSANSGVMAKSYPSSDFMRTLVDKIVNPRLRELWHDSALASSLKAPLEIRTDGTLTVPDGVIQPYVFQSYTGDVFGLMRKFADPYWNELFIEDREDGAYLVYRPFPFKDLAGKFIAPGKDPGSVTLTAGDVKTLSVDRSDVDVANYFWVDAPHYQGIAAAIMRDYARSHGDDYFLRDYPNDDPTLYGIRKMEVSTVQGPTDEETSGVARPKVQQAESESKMYQWITDRRQRLIDYNKDNGVYESGEMVLKGSELVRPGAYLVLDHGAFRPDHYTQSVTQIFQPFRSFITKARFIRGTGFIERTKFKDSPYLAERGSGVYG